MTVDSFKIFARFEGRPVFVTALIKTFIYMRPREG